MKSKKVTLYALYAATVILMAGCSVASKVPNGSYILKDNKVIVTNPAKGYKGEDLISYVKQDTKDNNIIGLKSLFIDPVLMDTTLFQSTIDGMRTHLEYLGYYYSDITPTVARNDVKKRAKVTYNVTLGKSFPINSVTLNVDDKDLSDHMKKNGIDFSIERGEILSENALENEAERIASTLRDDGYYGFSKNYFFFFADTTAVPDSAKLIVNLRNYTRNEPVTASRPHEIYTIGDVSINPQNGLKVTDRFLNNINRIYPDTRYSESSLNNAYQRYVSNRVFSSVNMNLVPRDSAIVDCNIYLSPSKMQSMKLNLEGSVNSTGLWGITPQISYSHKNLFKGGENFNVSVRGNFQFLPRQHTGFGEVALSSSLSLPGFLLLPGRWFNGKWMPTTDFSLTFNYQERPEYKRHMTSFTYGYSWRPNSNLRLQITPAKLNMTKIKDIDPTFYNNLSSKYLQSLYSNHFDLGGSFSLYYSTSEETSPTDTYFYLRWQNDFSGNLLSLFNGILPVNDYMHTIYGIPYSQYVRSQITLVQTFFFGNENQFQLAGRLIGGAGYAYGNSTAIPLENMFYAGGSSSLRGWQSRTIGPGDSPVDKSFAIANQVGDMRLEANLEFRFPIVWKLKGALFVDAGNIWNLPKKGIMGQRYVFNIKDMAKTSALDWGVGARVDLGMILIRIDMGLKQYDPVTKEWKKPSQWFKENGCAINFGIGLPF